MYMYLETWLQTNSRMLLMLPTVIVCVFLLQIKDDFLGRAMIHIDLRDTNPETRPHTVSEL